VSTLSNIAAIAEREYRVRVRTRSFILGTVLLVAGVIGIAMVPVILRAIEGTGATQRVTVWTNVADLGGDPAGTLGALLNAPTLGGPGGSPGSGGGYEVRTIQDLAAARAAVDRGEDTAALGITRGSAGELAFTLYTNDSATSRTVQLVRQAVTALAIAERLARLGVAPTDQARLFAPAAFSVAWPDPNRTDEPRTGVDEGADYLLGFGLTILIFMMIILYGQWVAMGVVEEKTSRVMEVILNAATPFQLLLGKVLGVGGLALTQYVAVVAAGVAALLLQAPLAERLLGANGEAVSLPAGLTPGMLALLLLYGVLGFGLYAVLYAAAGSLVSRQEDVNQAVMPMTLLATAGYLVATYSATGILNLREDWLAVLSQVPFLSPFLMLSRISGGQAAPWEVGLSVLLLVAAIVVAAWVAARIYAAGVLLYGQRPGLGALWRLMRSADRPGNEVARMR
jgi:ABC-2 type transport system permease protein